jgi:hypothetical protein
VQLDLWVQGRRFFLGILHSRGAYRVGDDLKEE